MGNFIFFKEKPKTKKPKFFGPCLGNFGFFKQKPKNQKTKIFWSMPRKLCFFGFLVFLGKPQKPKLPRHGPKNFGFLFFWFLLEKPKFPIHGPKNFGFLFFWFLLEKPKFPIHGPKNFGFLVLVANYVGQRPLLISRGLCLIAVVFSVR